MQFDIGRHIGAVTREVVSGERDGRETKIVVAGRGFDSDIADTWDALTNAERIPRWFLPVSGDLRLGGRYQIEGNAGGTITRCEPPRLLDADLGVRRRHQLGARHARPRPSRAAPSSSSSISPMPTTSSSNSGTSSAPARSASAGTWPARPRRHLETGETATEAADRWAASDEGKAFVTG